MRRTKSLLKSIILAGAIALPASAPAVGDATYTLATFRAMATPSASPSERLMAVYMASSERFDMLERLRAKYPTFVR